MGFIARLREDIANVRQHDPGARHGRNYTQLFGDARHLVAPAEPQTVAAGYNEGPGAFNITVHSFSDGR